MGSKEVQFQKGIIPSVVSIDETSGQYIIGDKARDGGIRGVTSAYNFKKEIGSSDVIYNSLGKYWINPGGGGYSQSVRLPVLLINKASPDSIFMCNGLTSAKYFLTQSNALSATGKYLSGS